jgi:phosphoglycerol transferase MdoB-like AlkP superfamily enzyme
MYADYALGKFFRQAERSDWFKNTLFVITADHTSLSYYKDFQTETGIYAIPLLFYMPGRISPEIKNKIAQQTDILPSILGFLNYEKAFLAFGNDVFDTVSQGFSVNYMNGKYQLIKDGWALSFDGKNTTSLKPLMGGDDQKGLYPATARELENFLKAYIQQYNHRLIHNQLIIEDTHE